MRHECATTHEESTTTTIPFLRTRAPIADKDKAGEILGVNKPICGYMDKGRRMRPSAVPSRVFTKTTRGLVAGTDTTCSWRLTLSRNAGYSRVKALGLDGRPFFEIKCARINPVFETGHSNFTAHPLALGSSTLCRTLPSQTPNAEWKRKPSHNVRVLTSNS